ALPLSMLALGFTLQVLWKRASRLASAPRVPRAAALGAIGIVCASLPALHVARDMRWLERREALRADAFRVEAVLRAEGAVRAGEIFTTDYDLYFPGLPGLTPLFNGGAVRLGTDWFNAAFPEFP